ncbi:MAG: hypothetical protein ACR2QW_16005 [bacterium]
MKAQVKLFSALLLLSFLSGCVSYTKSHLAQIEQGSKPKVIVITSIPNEVYIEYIGFLVFQNDRIKHPLNSEFVNQIDSHAKNLIAHDDIVEIVPLDSSDITDLENQLSSSLDEFWLKKFDSTQLQTVSGWGISNNADYVAIISPDGRQSIHYERAGYVAGKGILVDNMFQPYSHLFGSYEIALIDTATAQYSDIVGTGTFQSTLSLQKENVTDEEITKITKKWKQEVEKYEVLGRGQEPESLESRIELAKNYNSDDYANISEEGLLKVDKRLEPLALRSVQQSLIKLEIIHGEPIDGSVEFLKED